MVSKQRGITLLGFVVVLIVVAIFAVFAMNLFPVYREAFSVHSAMKGLADEPNAGGMKLNEIHRLLQKRFDIDYVESVRAKQATLERDKGGNVLSLEYEVRKPLFYNLDFVAMFDYKVPMSSAPSSAGDD